MIDNKKKCKKKEIIDVSDKTKNKVKVTLIELNSLLWPTTIVVLILIVLYLTTGKNINNMLNVLDKFSVIIGLFTTVFAASTWVKLQRLTNRKVSYLPDTGENSVVLIVGIGMNIKQNVVDYCARNNDLKKHIIDGEGLKKPQAFDSINEKIKNYGFIVDKIENNKRIVHVMHPDNFDIDEVSDCGENIYRVFTLIDGALRENGVGKIHLFYGGLLVVPFFLGELFSNRFDVYVYQRQISRKETNMGKTEYHFCGQMNHLAYPSI